MNQMNAPYMGFTLSWNFYTTDNPYAGYPDDRTAIDGVLEDLAKILSICARHELFFPTSILNDENEPVLFKSDDINKILQQIKQMLESNAITYEITQISGYGIVHLPGGEKARQDDLIGIGSARLFERQVNIFTSKSVWVPVCFDDSYNFDWQVELAGLNGSRLEQCLKDIHEALGTMVSPAPGETDKENPVWQAGFKLYVNPEILIREFESSPPPGLTALGTFLYKTEA